MGKALSVGEQGDAEVGLAGDDELVGVVDDEVVEPLGDDEDFVVLHVGARALVGVVLEVGHVGVYAVAVVDVEGGADEASTRLADGGQLDGDVPVVLEDALGDEGVLGAGNVGQALGEQVPEGV